MTLLSIDLNFFIFLIFLKRYKTSSTFKYKFPVHRNGKNKQPILFTYKFNKDDEIQKMFLSSMNIIWKSKQNPIAKLLTKTQDAFETHLHLITLL